MHQKEGVEISGGEIPSEKTLWKNVLVCLISTINGALLAVTETQRDILNMRAIYDITRTLQLTFGQGEAHQLEQSLYDKVRDVLIDAGA